MNRYIYCDFETQSTIDLKKQGAKVYIQHPHTRIMSGVFIVNGKVTVWVPKHVGMGIDFKKYGEVDRSAGLPARILQLAKTHTFVAHNAELFDKWLVEEKYPYRFNWLDTIHYCRAAGLPGALGKVLGILFNINKLDNLAMLMLCEAKVRNGKPVYPVGNFAIWKKMLDYNVQDVKHLEKLLSYLESTGVIEAEKANVKKHEEINARGFKVNRELVVLLRKMWVDLQARAVDEVAELTNGALTEKDLYSPIKVKNYLQSLGYAHNTLNAQLVNQIIARPEDFLEGDDAESMLALLMIRKNAIRATPGKLDRMLAELDDDDVARRSIIFYGAHTGRPTGRGINPLNFPRGTKLGVLEKAKDYTLDTLLCKLQNGTANLSPISEYAKANSNEKVKVNEGDILNTLTRNCLIPHGTMFHIADMSQIEARLVSKLANCKTLLDAFADPKRDVYCEYGTVQFGRPITAEDEVERYVSKTIVLGCIAKGTPVLTHMGWKNIELVTCLDKVWDGESFVECDGAIAKGRKVCYNVSGVWMTPDHKVLTNKGWVESCQLSESTHSQPKGWYSENLRFNLLNLGSVEGLNQSLQLANAVQQKTTTIIPCDTELQRNVLLAETKRLQRASIVLAMLCLTVSIVIGLLDVLGKFSPVVTILNIPIIAIMAGVVSRLNSQLSETSSLILLRCRDGITANSKSTESRIMEITELETSDLQQDRSKCVIVETYDILNCGFNNRFQAGKLIVHNCGYGMGHRKLKLMADIFGIDLEKVGLTAKACIDTYRKTYPEIKRLWQKLQDACKNAVECPGIEFEAGYSKFKLLKNYQSTGIDFLRLTLPSGRNLWYRDCYMETTPAPWNDQEQITQPHYTTSFNFRRSLYGGILAENICQATGRDIQCLAKLKLDRTVLDVYDELCGEDDLETLVKAMSTVPKWLKGLPIEAKGFSAPCYSKEPLGKFKKVTAINGAIR